MSRDRVILSASYDPETFRDREETWQYPWRWVEGILRYRTDRGIALIAHRRLGKTALLEKLYNTLFNMQGEVIPFYFRCPERPISYRTLAKSLIHCAVWQYLAFKLNRPSLVVYPGEIENAKPLAEKNNL